MTNKNFEDAPFGVFRLGYSAFTWASTALIAFILVWVAWTMFVNTPAGTRRTQQLASIRPTQEALLTQVPERLDPCRPPSPEGLATCTACHAIQGIGNAVCPNLTAMLATAADRIKSADYTGKAKTAEDYVRESILLPNAYIVANDEGKVYSTAGKSIMPEGVADKLDVDALVAYITYDPEAPCDK
jgi:cytochrome c2